MLTPFMLMADLTYQSSDTPLYKISDFILLHVTDNLLLSQDNELTGDKKMKGAW